MRARGGEVRIRAPCPGGSKSSTATNRVNAANGCAVCSTFHWAGRCGRARPRWPSAPVRHFDWNPLRMRPGDEEDDDEEDDVVDSSSDSSGPEEPPTPTPVPLPAQRCVRSAPSSSTSSSTPKRPRRQPSPDWTAVAERIVHEGWSDHIIHHCVVPRMPGVFDGTHPG